MIMLVVYNSVCQQGFGRLCWWTPFFGSGDMVGIPAGYDCPPAWSYLVGIFYLTLFRGFVIILCEGNQILSLCMLRFNPFPRGLSWCSLLLFGVTLQRYSVGWWWGIFFFVRGLTLFYCLCYNMGASEEHFLLGSFRVFLPVVMTPCGVRLCEVCGSLRWLYVDRPLIVWVWSGGLNIFRGET